MRWIGIAAIAVILLGCSKTESAAPADAPAKAAATEPAKPEFDPAQILAEVNGKKLTRGEAETQVGYKLATVKDSIPAERKREIHDQVLNSFVDQFITQTVLLDEADRRNFVVTPADESNAFKSIQASLPPGLTPEAVMKNSPMGEERMRAEVLKGVRLNRLIEESAASVKVPDQEVDDFIQKNRASLRVPETVHARHILVGFKPDDTDASKAEKKSAAEELRKKLQAGADFAAVAKESSSCPSAPKGGDLGEFRRGQMVKAFEDAAFSQAVNEIGPLVETQFGYHIVQVLAHSKEGEMPREKVQQMLLNRKRREAQTAFVEELKAKATIKDFRTGSF